MRIWLDPVLMAAHNVTAVDVARAIQSSNFLSSPGSTQNELLAFAIETDTTLKSPEAFGTPAAQRFGNNIVRLRDVAHIELGSASINVRTSINGREGVFIGVSPTPSANPLDVGREIRALMPEIQKELPQGTDVLMAYDATVFIDASVGKSSRRSPKRCSSSSR